MSTALVIIPEVELVEYETGEGALARMGVEVHLDASELAFIRTLAAATGFVRSVELTHITSEVRYVARRLERRLAALGEPSVIEVCERRGYRLRTPLAPSR